VSRVEYYYFFRNNFLRSIFEIIDRYNQKWPSLFEENIVRRRLVYWNGSELSYQRSFWRCFYGIIRIRLNYRRPNNIPFSWLRSPSPSVYCFWLFSSAIYIVPVSEDVVSIVWRAGSFYYWPVYGWRLAPWKRGLRSFITTKAVVTSEWELRLRLYRSSTRCYSVWRVNKRESSSFITISKRNRRDEIDISIYQKISIDQKKYTMVWSNLIASFFLLWCNPNFCVLWHVMVSSLFFYIFSRFSHLYNWVIIDVD